MHATTADGTVRAGSVRQVHAAAPGVPVSCTDRKNLTDMPPSAGQIGDNVHRTQAAQIRMTEPGHDVRLPG
jgi:hypothetical protein